mmetsp:Transcript_86505/g.225683  ORF Transcript_86505/g.225683 Transcript_86505/m.225683 type:complete len:288 (-) Transcript_86505:561-1424(-)
MYTEQVPMTTGPFGAPPAWQQLNEMVSLHQDDVGIDLDDVLDGNAGDGVAGAIPIPRTLSIHDVVVPVLRGRTVEPAHAPGPQGAQHRDALVHARLDLVHAVLHLEAAATAWLRVEAALVGVQVHKQGLLHRRLAILRQLDGHALQLPVLALREGDGHVEILLRVDHGARGPVLLPVEGGEVRLRGERTAVAGAQAVRVRLPAVGEGVQRGVPGKLVALEEVDLLAEAAVVSGAVAAGAHPHGVEVRVAAAVEAAEPADGEAESLADQVAVVAAVGAVAVGVEAVPA